MPLYDHFRGPLARRAWQSFHSRWATAICDDLNRRLPRPFVADAPMSFGSSVSADVAEYEDLLPADGHDRPPTGGGVAVEVYAPPAATLSMTAGFDTEVKVEVRDTTDDYKLLGVVELVSPGNKKEADERERFAAKCSGYLGRGVGLVMIDIVTHKPRNLHNQLVRLGEKGEQFEMADDPPVYVVAYRPVHRNHEDRIDLWPYTLAVGMTLPAVPLALKGYGCVRLDLEATYAEACDRLRIP